MANNLKDHLKEVADAIRAKKGTSDLINPQDFATEIEGISGGGESGGSGESASNVEYWDISAFSDAEKPALLQFCAMMVNINGNVMSPYALLEGDFPLTVINKIATVPSFEIGGGGGKASIAQLIEMYGWATRIQRITKEQFYNLNA